MVAQRNQNFDTRKMALAEKIVDGGQRKTLDRH